MNLNFEVVFLFQHNLNFWKKKVGIKNYGLHYLTEMRTSDTLTEFNYIFTLSKQEYISLSTTNIWN